MKYEGSVSKRLQPTFENVTYEFITKTMHKIFYSKELPNFRIQFIEQEAMEYINKVLQAYAKGGEFARRKSQEIFRGLENIETDKPVIVVRDYIEFFEQLRSFYEEHIRMFFKRTGFSSFHSYAMENCFDLIWLRMTPEDFNDPEKFLEKQVEMIKDNTFHKYDEEMTFGSVHSFGDNILCVQNRVARIWDEASQEMCIKIYDKDYYDRKELFERPNYELPVIRYGILKKDGKRICRIASIQNKEVDNGKSSVHKRIDRAKYKVNEGVTSENIQKVEPKSLIALSIFMALLNQEGINEIEVPSMYVLDEEYHLKRSEKLIREFQARWDSNERIEKDKERYEYDKAYLERTYEKHELISEIKTERFIKLFTRLLEHYPLASVQSYPADLDSYYHIKVPKIKSKGEIKNTVLQELYGVVEKKYSNLEL